jgi:hypothetical protein
MGRRLRWKAYQPPSRAANVAAINADHSAPGRDPGAWRSTISAVALVGPERLELPLAVGPAPRDDVTSGTASVFGVEDGDGDDDSGTDGVGAVVAGAAASVDAGVAAGGTDRGAGTADLVVGAPLADAGNVVAMASGGTVETVAGTLHLGRGRTLGGSAVGREMTGGNVVLELLGLVSDGAVAGGSVSGGAVAGGSVSGGSVSGGSVSGGSVDSGTVESGTVEWGSGGRMTASSIPSAEETLTGSALPSTTAITSSSTTSHVLRSACAREAG